MISTGPKGNKAFFMSTFWNSSAGNLSVSSRAFQHRPLRSTSNESLNNSLLSNETTNNFANKNTDSKEKQYTSQKNSDDLSEIDYTLTCELTDNCLHKGSDCGELKKTCKSKCEASPKLTKRIGELKRNEKGQQKNLLKSILDDTDDMVEYFDDHEIYSTTTADSATNNPDHLNWVASSGKNNENIAVELLRMLSIKSANTWWRISGKNNGPRAKDSATQTIPDIDVEKANCNLIEIEMNSVKGEKCLGSNRKLETAILKLKTFSKLNEDKKKKQQFTAYQDEPVEESNSEFVNQVCSKIYTVKDCHETLRSIAAKFLTTPAEIKCLNRLSQDHVFVGQLLLIPLMETLESAQRECTQVNANLI